MRSDFHERLENKLERCEELADKNIAKSAQGFEKARQIADMIPMGQPILVGHHSEAHHRADITRIDNGMRQGIDAQNTAQYYQGKAKRIESQLEGKGPIRSDDPEAIVRLKQKIESLEKAKKVYKEINSIIRKTAKGGREAQATALLGAGFDENTVTKLLMPDFAGRIGIPDYEVTNLSANIRRLKKRLEEEQESREQEDREYMLGEVNVIESVTDNRIQLFFPGKPDDAMRAKLKHGGFRWAGSIGCWQRQLNESARWAAKRVLGEVSNG